MKIFFIFILLFFCFNFKLFSNKKPNIIIISICSLSFKHLDIYGYNRNTTPNITALSKNSYIFKNVFTSIAWSNIRTSFVRSQKKDKFNFIKENNYTTIQPKIFIDEEKKFAPNTEIPPFFISFRAMDNFNPEYVKKRMNILKKEFIKKRKSPFIIEIHFKSLHFPYCNKNRKFYDYRKYFNDTSEKLFNSYSNIDNNNNLKINFNNNPGKLPLFGLLFNQTNLNRYKQKELFIYNNKKNLNFDINTNFGYLWNTLLLRKWKTTYNYSYDIQILKDCYDSKLYFIDSQLKELLNFFNNKELKKNTVIIVMGDHGEAFMEHGHVLHGGSTYDEEIHIPVIIKFPETKNQKFLNEQFSMNSIMLIAKNIMKQNIDNDNFKNFASKNFLANEIYSHNLNNNIFSLRQNNKYKFIYNSNTDKKELYDLKSDPLENNNVYKKYPEISGDLEEKMFDHIIEYSSKIKKHKPKN